MGYALWLVPSDHDGRALANIMAFRPSGYRKRPSSRSYPPLDPHITLVTFETKTCPPLSVLLPSHMSKGPAPAKFQALRRGDNYLGAMSVTINLDKSPELDTLHDGIEKSLKRLGLTPRSRRFPHMSLFYVDEDDERVRLEQQLWREGLVRRRASGNGIVLVSRSRTSNEEFSEKTEMRSFAGEQVWLVDCNSRKVEEWSVMEKFSLVSLRPCSATPEEAQQAESPSASKSDDREEHSKPVSEDRQLPRSHNSSATSHSVDLRPQPHSLSPHTRGQGLPNHPLPKGSSPSHSSGTVSGDQRREPSPHPADNRAASTTNHDIDLPEVVSNTVQEHNEHTGTLHPHIDDHRFPPGRLDQNTPVRSAGLSPKTAKDEPATFALSQRVPSEGPSSASQPSTKKMKTEHTPDTRQGQPATMTGAVSSTSVIRSEEEKVPRKSDGQKEEEKEKGKHKFKFWASRK